MQPRHVFLFCLLLSASACTPMPSPGKVASPLPPVTLQAYVAPAAHTPTATPGITLAPPLPTPTPTPVVYTVAADDTLLGIAARFGISLDDLLAANPGVDPRFLSIGMTLTVPLSPQAAAAPAGLLLPLEISPPRCTPLPDTSQWCVVLVHNPHPQAVTAVSLAWGAAGQESALPLDVLPPESTLPAAVILPGGEEMPSVALRSALPWSGAQEDLPRIIQQVRLDAPAAHTRLQGQVSPAPEGVQEVQLLALGYDQQGAVVALRQAVLPVANGAVTYALTLYAQNASLSEAQVWAFWR